MSMPKFWLAAVMGAARVLASRELDFSVRFIAFSAEEWGLYGSQAYAAAETGFAAALMMSIANNVIAP
jgi:Zn-dependent M28 family amino/carboxypeptidase